MHNLSTVIHRLRSFDMADPVITIDKGVPLPPLRRKWPFVGMEVGDSFFIDRPTAAFSGVAGVAGARLGRKFTCRAENGGCRVWRVA